MEIVWNIPCETAWDRVEELEEFIAHFPDSPLVPAFENALKHLRGRLL